MSPSKAKTNAAVLRTAATHARSQAIPVHAQKKSLNLGAYKTLLWEIVTLALAPGTALSEASLAKRLQHGKAAIRFAIQRLQMEHLVRVVPRGGTFVAELAISEIAQAYAVRTYLEILAVRICAQRGSAEALERIGNALDSARRAHEAGELLDFSMKIQAFYECIYHAVPERYAVPVCPSGGAYHRPRFEYYCVRELQRSPVSLEAHVGLFNAIRGRDAAAVEAAMAPIGKFRADTMSEMLGDTLSSRPR